MSRLCGTDRISVGVLGLGRWLHGFTGRKQEDMIPINRLERWPFPGNLPPGAVGRVGELTIDDGVLSVYGTLLVAFGEATGAMVFELLKRLATAEAEKLGGGVPCISFDDELGEFASIRMDEEDDVADDDEAWTDSDDEWEAGEGESDSE
jgi:hypothetical protein